MLEELAPHSHIKSKSLNSVDPRGLIQLQNLQPVLPLAVSIIQQCQSACVVPGRFRSTAVCAVPGRVCVSVIHCTLYSSLYSRRCLACNMLLVLHLDVSFHQQPVLCQEVYGLQQLLLHLDCLATWSCAATGRICLQELLCCTWTCLSTVQEPVLLLCVSVYKSFCATPGRVCLQEHVLHLWVCMSVYKSFALHLDVSTYKSLAHGPQGVPKCLQ
jgi:hypothetical protein